MAYNTYVYGQALLNFSLPLYLTDSIKVMLMTSTYTPNKDTHAFKSDITNEVVGTNYVATGQALASKTAAYLSATTAPAWAAATAYVVGDVVRKVAANGHVYRCIVAGTSGGGEPAWPTTPGVTIVDNTVTWAESGFGVLTFSAANPVWAASTLTARYAAIYDATPASDATRPLLCYIDFGADQSTTNASFTIQVSGDGLFRIPID